MHTQVCARGHPEAAAMAGRCHTARLAVAGLRFGLSCATWGQSCRLISGCICWCRLEEREMGWFRRRRRDDSPPLASRCGDLGAAGSLDNRETENCCRFLPVGLQSVLLNCSEATIAIDFQPQLLFHTDEVFRRNHFIAEL